MAEGATERVVLAGVLHGLEELGIRIPAGVGLMCFRENPPAEIVDCSMSDREVNKGTLLFIQAHAWLFGNEIDHLFLRMH